MFFGKKPDLPEAAAQPAQADSGSTIEQKTELAPEEAKKRAAMAKQIAASFGQIVTLLMRSPADKAITLQDLEWMVVPAIMTGQFAVADAQSKETGMVMPVAAVLWANVSADLDQQLTSNPEHAPRLTAQDWRSGDQPWVVMAIGEPRIVSGMLQQLMQSAFAGKVAKMRGRGEDGKITIVRLEPAQFSSQSPAA
jgi:hemolysin-activating ACP:hemolysin acyltransferase